MKREQRPIIIGLIIAAIISVIILTQTNGSWFNKSTPSMNNPDTIAPMNENVAPPAPPAASTPQTAPSDTMMSPAAAPMDNTAAPTMNAPSTMPSDMTTTPSTTPSDTTTTPSTTPSDTTTTPSTTPSDTTTTPSTTTPSDTTNGASTTNSAIQNEEMNAVDQSAGSAGTSNPEDSDQTTR